MKKIDNSSLLPKIRPDSEVKLNRAEVGGELMTPDWADSLIMVELHTATATAEGTLKAAVKVLDHIAETGANGIWLTPVYEMGAGGNGYGNLGPHTIEPSLTGTNDRADGWLALRNFIGEAHKRNIRVLLDIITWGTMNIAPIKGQHPDWFEGTAWGGAAFKWSNAELREWFTCVTVENIINTGADGLRCDCEPFTAGYELFAEIRRRLYAAGRKILIVAEDGCERLNAFDFEQDGVLDYLSCTRGEQYQHPRAFYLGANNIVEAVKSGRTIGQERLQRQGVSGRYRLYTYCVSNHDFQYSLTNLNRLVIGYQAIFAPFLPLWYLGAEIGMTAERVVIYDKRVDWSVLEREENAAFFEDVKRYIKIRRSYPEIFESWTDDHRQCNIEAVESAGTKYQSYMRYRDDKAVIIAAGAGESCTITMPNGYAKATNLLTDAELEVKDGHFTDFIKDEHIGVYLIEK